MKLTEDTYISQITEQTDSISEIVQKMNELSKKLGLIKRRCFSFDEDEDEDEDEDWEDEEDDEDEDDEDELDW